MNRQRSKFIFLGNLGLLLYRLGLSNGAIFQCLCAYTCSASQNKVCASYIARRSNEKLLKLFLP
jgi:hypothetical protein